MQLDRTRRVSERFEAQPWDYTLTTSYELCHCSPIAGAGHRLGVHRLDAQSLGQGCDIKLDPAYIYRVIDVPHFKWRIERVSSEFKARTPTLGTLSSYGTLSCALWKPYESQQVYSFTRQQAPVLSITYYNTPPHLKVTKENIWELNAYHDITTYVTIHVRSTNKQMIEMAIDSFFIACKVAIARVQLCTDTGWCVPKQSCRSEFVVVTTTIDRLLVCRQLEAC